MNQSRVVAIKMQTVAMQDVAQWPVEKRCGQSPAICFISSRSCPQGLSQALGFLCYVEHLFDVKKKVVFCLLTN